MSYEISIYPLAGVFPGVPEGEETGQGTMEEALRARLVVLQDLKLAVVH